MKFFCSFHAGFYLLHSNGASLEISSICTYPCLRNWTHPSFFLTCQLFFIVRRPKFLFLKLGLPWHSPILISVTAAPYVFLRNNFKITSKLYRHFLVFLPLEIVLRCNLSCKRSANYQLLLLNWYLSQHFWYWFLIFLFRYQPDLNIAIFLLPTSTDSCWQILPESLCTVIIYLYIWPYSPPFKTRAWMLIQIIFHIIKSRPSLAEPFCTILLIYNLLTCT